MQIDFLLILTIFVLLLLLLLLLLFKYLGSLFTNQNYIQEKLKCGLKAEKFMLIFSPDAFVF